MISDRQNISKQEQIAIELMRVYLGFNNNEFQEIKNPDKEDANGDTILRHLIKKKAASSILVDFLKTTKASVNLLNSEKKSPLQLAFSSEVRLASLVKDLLDCGADQDITFINEHDVDTFPLLECAYREDLFGIKVMSYLIAAGANLNRTNSDSESALYRAARYGKFEVCELLLEAGASTYYEKSGKKIAISSARNIVADLLKTYRKAEIIKDELDHQNITSNHRKRKSL